MSKPLPRRALRPGPEPLEARELLAKTITGLDSTGDSWTLRLIGPGDIRVTKVNDANGNPSPLNSMTDINTITLVGTDPFTSRLVGHVTPAPGSPGRVYFDSLTEQNGISEGTDEPLGINSINIPGFWLGNTTGTAPSAGGSTGQISIPDGVVTLRFGGADATYNTAALTTASPGTANTLAINLGLPYITGTSVIVDQMISGTRQSTPSGSTTPTTLQDSVTLNMIGRLNLFQANSVVGDSANPSSGFIGGGGTLIADNGLTSAGITGEIGFIRVGGDATNFAVQSSDKVSNYYVGGETNNIFLLSPGGSRSLYFGRGLDTATIATHTFENLYANRGALNSNVETDRPDGRILIGGDVVNSRFLSGYQLGLANELSTQTAPTTFPEVASGGGFTALVAGNVTDTVFAASADPQAGTFGTNDIFAPHSQIAAKIEGTINNATATPDSPSTAFYAKNVHLVHGPVVPPTVPEPPFPGGQPIHRGQASLLAPNLAGVPSTLNPPNEPGPDQNNPFPRQYQFGASSGQGQSSSSSGQSGSSGSGGTGGGTQAASIRAQVASNLAAIQASRKTSVPAGPLASTRKKA